MARRPTPISMRAPTKRRLSSEGKRIRGSAGVKARARRLARTNGLCEMCIAEGREFPAQATVVDHRRPLALGGEDVDENTRNLCPEHNEQLTAEQFGFRRRVAVDADGWPVNR